MAPTFTVTTPACSYVCIRGSGWDKTAAPVCKDLSNVSTLVASYNMPVHRMFRTSLTPPNPSPNTTVPQKSQKVEDLQAKIGLKRVREEVSGETPSTASSRRTQKVARQENKPSTPKPVTNRAPSLPKVKATPQTAPKAVQRPTQPSKIQAVQAPVNTTSSTSPSTSPRTTSLDTLRPARPQDLSQANTAQRSSPPTLCVQTLLEEKRQLLRLNEILVRRLQGYQTVFASRNTLQRVMVNLGIEVC